MAGQPKKRATRQELERRAIAELGEGALPLDYLVWWQENGHTIVELAAELTIALGMGDISRETVRRAASEGEDERLAEQRLAHARTRGAHAVLEEAKARTDGAVADKDVIAKVRLQNDLDMFMAGVWNRREMGSSKDAGVVINVQHLHLDALRTTEVIANPLQHALPRPQVEEAQEVTIE